MYARKPTRAPDDPVTGLAAGCAAAFLVDQGLAKSGERVVIEQGSEVMRPGELYVSSVKGAAGVRQVGVGGYAVRVFEGRASFQAVLVANYTIEISFRTPSRNKPGFVSARPAQNIGEKSLPSARANCGGDNCFIISTLLSH